MHQEEASESLKQVLYGGTIAFLVLAGFVIFFLLMYIKRKTKSVMEKKQLQSEFSEMLLKTQLEIQEQTLKTISQEIHDNIGQVLSLAKLNLNTMDITRQEELKEKILDSKNLVSKAIQDLRNLSKSMNTDNIEALGLVRALEYEMEMIRKAGIVTALDVTGKIIRLGPQKELILFRIVQEVLNNIIKHAEAGRIEVTVVYDGGDMRLTIKDNGKGFDLTPVNNNDDAGFGLGIRNMHNRAQLIGASFSISSTAGEGTLVSLALPINNHNL